MQAERKGGMEGRNVMCSVTMGIVHTCVHILHSTVTCSCTAGRLHHRQYLLASQDDGVQVVWSLRGVPTLSSNASPNTCTLETHIQSVLMVPAQTQVDSVLRICTSHVLPLVLSSLVSLCLCGCEVCASTSSFFRGSSHRARTEDSLFHSISFT